MMDIENIINLSSDEVSWQSYLEAMVNFMNSRVRGGPIAELYEYGLKVYLNFPGSKSASLFLMDTDGFLFHQSISIPNIDPGYCSK